MEPHKGRRQWRGPRGGFGTLLASCRHQAPPGTPPGLRAPGLTPRPVQPLPSVPHRTVPPGPMFPPGHAVPRPSASWGEAPRAPRGSRSRHLGDPHPSRSLSHPLAEPPAVPGHHTPCPAWSPACRPQDPLDAETPGVSVEAVEVAQLHGVPCYVLNPHTVPLGPRPSAVMAVVAAASVSDEGPQLASRGDWRTHFFSRLVVHLVLEVCAQALPGSAVCMGNRCPRPRATVQPALRV
ncbi:nematocyst expressed protein 3-like [Eubalaena glacialis]|uniref:nematocyst expressed protein 3-like n=1 Tax=Eubalaena glacialis TaxID=27606 RepID=UPI002A5AE08D|nr:nematocyst expressed protein 3-like [Eubalaena glacialis]